MCGLAGFWDPYRKTSLVDAEARVRSMTDAIRHRGPDDAGLWCDPAAGIALGHRRLSIVDLSSLGHQPMKSHSGRYVLVYNGEIYNHSSIKKDLAAAGFAFRGRSDTEILLAAVECWGLDAALQRFVGMFAFALWDRREQFLTLVRDRLGIKPLYFGWVGDLFVFGSELHAICALPGFANQVDRNALMSFMRDGYIAAPHSIYEGLRKLAPGSILSVDIATAKARSGGSTDARTRAYWSARSVAAHCASEPDEVDDSEAITKLDGILRDAVGLRMEADVPLGAFLSGGVDSSLVVALMQDQSCRPVRTFSIGFFEDRYDESQYAQAVAAHLGTDHTELRVDAAQALEVVPKLPIIADEPMADSSLIPTFLVSSLAKRDVTVSLSGDGGDELFGGYTRYLWAERLRATLERAPQQLVRVTGRSLQSQSWLLAPMLDIVNRFAPARLRLRQPRGKFDLLADLLRARDDDDRYRLLVSIWRDPAVVVLDGSAPPLATLDDVGCAPVVHPIHRMMLADLIGYLPGDILTKVDRASMAVSLEARVPLMDHRVVEHAWRVPMHQKVRGGEGKWLLRQVLYRYVPRALIDRPKRGFSVPLAAWLRGPLREWAESLLDEQQIREEGFFDVAVVAHAWRSHLSGGVDLSGRLWAILMFRAWMAAKSG